MSSRNNRKKKRISFPIVLIFILALACLIVAVVPRIKEARHPDIGSSAQPALFSSRSSRIVMADTSKQAHDLCALTAKNGRASAKEAEAAKKEAAKKKVKEVAGKLVSEKKKETAKSKTNNEEAGSEYYKIMGSPGVTEDQIVRHFNANAQYPTKQMTAGGAPTIEDFVRIICEEASLEGVRPEVVYAQAMLETGWLRFGGDDSIKQYNFAGLGTVGDGNHGLVFPDVRTGIRAQVQHLKAYACEDDLNEACVDPRFDKVLRGAAPYVQWLGIQENPDGVGWAGAEDYGSLIMKLIIKTRSM